MRSLEIDRPIFSPGPFSVGVVVVVVIRLAFLHCNVRPFSVTARVGENLERARRRRQALIAVGVQGGLLSVCQLAGLTDGMPAPLTTAKKKHQRPLVGGGGQEENGWGGLKAQSAIM